MSDIKPSAWIVSNRNNQEVVTRDEKFLSEICGYDESIVLTPLYKEKDIRFFIEKERQRCADICADKSASWYNSASEHCAEVILGKSQGV